MALTLVEMELPIQQYLHEGHTVPTVLSPLSPGTLHEPCPGHMGRSHHIHASLVTPRGKMTPHAHCPLPPAPGSLPGSKFYSIHPDPLVLSPERITKSQSPLPVMELCQGPSLKPLLVLFFSSDYAGIQIEMRAQ